MNKSVHLSGSQLAVSLYEQGDELTIVASSPTGERYECHLGPGDLGNERLSQMDMLEKQVMCEELCRQLELVPADDEFPELGLELVLKRRGKKQKGEAEAKSEPRSKDEAKGAKEGDRPASLLGDLPALFSTKIDLAVVSPTSSDSKQESKGVRSKKRAENAPEQFKCGITHQCMDDPVSSPYGDVFEKEVIEEWLQKQGQICPISGKALSKDQLEPHTQLRQEISQWHIQQAMGKADAKEESKGEDDLYDF
jgi:hypothetical protein